MWWKFINIYNWVILISFLFDKCCSAPINLTCVDTCTLYSFSSPVERYTGAKEDRRGTLSRHSIQKKVRRMQQVFTQLTGLRSKVSQPWKTLYIYNRNVIKLLISDYWHKVWWVGEQGHVTGVYFKDTVEGHLTVAGRTAGIVCSE